MTHPRLRPDELDAHCASKGECIDYADELERTAHRTRPEPTTPPPVAGDELDDAVRLVEDAIDATSEQNGHAVTPTDRTGRAVVDALLEAGWQPPDDLVGHALLSDGRPIVLLREHPGDVRGPKLTVRPLTYRRVW